MCHLRAYAMRLLDELQYTLRIKQTKITFHLLIYYYAIMQRIFGSFLNLNSSKYPTVTTLRQAAADDIGMLLHGLEFD